MTEFLWGPCFSQKLLSEQYRHEASGEILFLCHKEKARRDNTATKIFLSDQSWDLHIHIL